MVAHLQLLDTGRAIGKGDDRERYSTGVIRIEYRSDIYVKGAIAKRFNADQVIALKLKGS